MVLAALIGVILLCKGAEWAQRQQAEADDQREEDRRQLARERAVWAAKKP
jgi:hypothetical protein